ncbi:hypothetical protein ACFU53_15865 [Streptomyces sp. NPDC057474]|uniref:hypothetical protein n=1 Tax=Streptomyces sp. NPDC057474 TaxID=3346144 RepID=UPI00367BADEA
MSAPQWQYRDEGSGGPGHLQAVAPSGVYARYRAFTDHTLGCDDCEYGEARCDMAKALWATYARARETAA